MAHFNRERLPERVVHAKVRLWDIYRNARHQQNILQDVLEIGETKVLSSQPWRRKRICRGVPELEFHTEDGIDLVGTPVFSKAAKNSEILFIPKKSELT
jgi:hypothetical protein